jgi:hypothetical protein
MVRPAVTRMPSWSVLSGEPSRSSAVNVHAEAGAVDDPAFPSHDIYMARDRDRDLRTWTIDDIRREFERYCNLINASDRAPTTKGTYIQHADRFVRWMAGEVDI